MTRPIRVLVAKPGLDGRGPRWTCVAKVIARARRRDRVAAIRPEAAL